MVYGRRFIMKKLVKALKNPKVVFWNIAQLGGFKWMSDESYLKLAYRVMMGKKLNLDNPITYNEKLQWLKLYDRRPEYITMVDKYDAKKYVADIIGEEPIIPTYGVWNSFDEINFDKLPDQFVLKCTHDSGGIAICKNKKTFNVEKARKLLTRNLQNNFYYTGRDWPYKNVKPRIIAEKYIEDSKLKDLPDYKIFTFDGVAKALYVASDRQNPLVETKFDYFDMDYNNLDIVNGHENSKILPEKPVTLDKMRDWAEKIGKGIPQARIDFYEVDGQVYFGEITLFHLSGVVPFKPEKWDKIFGEWIQLPIKRN
jgi:hypothetical protein